MAKFIVEETPLTKEQIKALKNLVYETYAIDEILNRREALRNELRNKNERAAEIVKMANYLLEWNIGEERFRSDFGGKWKFAFNNANCSKKHAEVVSIHYNKNGFDGVDSNSGQLDWHPHCGFSFRNYTAGDDIKNKDFILDNREIEMASESFDNFEAKFYLQVKHLLEYDYKEK